MRGRQNWQLDPTLPAGDYQLMLQMIGPGGETSPPVELGAVTVAGRPHVFAPPAQMAVASGGRIGDFARLLGFDTDPAPSVAADGSATITVLPAAALASTLYWQAEGASDVPYAVSVQLLDETGVLRAQHDQQPGGGAFPTTSWVQGEVLVGHPSARTACRPGAGELSADRPYVRPGDACGLPPPGPMAAGRRCSDACNGRGSLNHRPQRSTTH